MPEKEPVWALLVGWIDRPGRILANIVAYPRWRWLWPMFLTLVILAGSLALTAPQLTVQARQVMAQQIARMPAEQVQLVQAQMAQFQKPEVIVGTAFATAIFGLVIGWLIQAAMLYFGVLIAGSELEFKRILAATPWLGLPFAIETGLQAVFAVTQGHLIVNQGLSFLVSVGKPLEDVRNLAYVALSQLTLFRLWHWVLVYALLRMGAKLGARAAFSLTLVYAALNIGLQLALAALGSMLNPS